MNPIATAVNGLQAAEQRFDASANRLVRAGEDPTVDTAGEIVNQIQAKEAFSANLATIKVSDEMWRALIDIQTKR
jgi:flagellar hook protein FlgE